MLGGITNQTSNTTHYDNRNSRRARQDQDGFLSQPRSARNNSQQMEQTRNQGKGGIGMRKPRVHAGADDYFQRKPNVKPLKIVPKRGSGFNNPGGSDYLVYLYWILGGLAAIVLIYLLGSFLKTAGVSAKLVYQEGTVEVKKGGEGEWEKVENDAKLKKLDEIRTLEGSKAIISFDDGSLVRLNEFSRIILSAESDKTIVIQTDGSSYHRVATTEDKTYEVQLSGIDGMQEDSKITAQGTAFWVEKIGATELSIGVLESKVVYTQASAETGLDEGQKMLINYQENKTETKEVSLEDLQEDFISWNIEQDQKKELAISSYVRLKLASAPEESEAMEETTEEEDSEENTSEETGLVLTGEASSSGVVLKWNLNGVEAPNGFKIVKGSTMNPEYPGSYYRSVRSSETGSYTWDVTDGETHHFRICVYDGSTGCDLYSNDLEIEAKEVDKSEAEENCKNSGGTWDSDSEKCNCDDDEELKDGKCVAKEEEVDEKEECTDSGGTWDDDDEECNCGDGEELDDYRCVKKDYADSVSLSGSSKDKGEATLKWSISGGSAPDGYKIVKSKSKNPTYPDDSEKSISSSSTTSVTLDDLKEGETYYFRVCVWNKDDDKCEVYSGNEKIEIDD